MTDSESSSEAEYQIKFLSDSYYRVVDYFISHNIPPNTLSLIGFLCLLGTAFLIAIGMVHFPIWFSWPVQFLIIIGGFLDAIDGEVARKTNNETLVGAFLDSNLDRLSDAVIILSLIYGGLVDFLHGFIILFLVIMISYTRSCAENHGVKMKGVGLMERHIRIIYLLIATIIESWVYFIVFLIYGIEFDLIFRILMWIFTGLLIYTLAQRLIFGYNTLK